MDAGENIKVVLRIRPFNETERSRGDRKVIECTEDRRTVQLCGGAMEDFGRSASIRSFTFNEVFEASCDQQMFFERCGVKGLVCQALQGYSATLFAYGQTGSGKTYSVSGAEDVIADESYSGGDPQEGIIPRAVRFLYQEMSKETSKKYVLKAACIEIYNEQVLDLLNPEAGQLQIRESRSQGFFVENLLVVECSGVSDLMEVFKEGTRNRHVGPHALNRDSSRSHCLLTLYVDGFFTDEDTGEEVRQYGKLTFVDLAGSERLKYSGSSGEMLKETGNINRSLFTLGKVIAALDKQEKGDVFVPYRDSKLTKLLMDSLGGNSSCIMVACCSPSLKYAEETLSTLHYASRAKNIRNKPVVQLDPQQRLIQQLRQEIAALRAENTRLRDGSAGPELLEGRASPLSNSGAPRKALNRSASGALVSALPADSTGRVPLYEKAVGYAEGYAEGLQQAREALSSRGLDLAACLTQYDLSRMGSLERRDSSRGSQPRLPPLDGLQRDGSFGSLRGSGAANSARSGNGGGGQDRSVEVYAEETAALRRARAELEQRCLELERQCEKLRSDRARPRPDAGRGLCDNGSSGGAVGGQSAEAIVQQTRIERLTAENAELKRMLNELLLQRDETNDGSGGAGSGLGDKGYVTGGGSSKGHDGEGGLMVSHAPLGEPPSANASHRRPAGQQAAASVRRTGPESSSQPGRGGADGGLFCSTEAAIWSSPHWTDPSAPPGDPTSGSGKSPRRGGESSRLAPEPASRTGGGGDRGEQPWPARQERGSLREQALAAPPAGDGGSGGDRVGGRGEGKRGAPSIHRLK